MQLKREEPEAGSRSVWGCAQTGMCGAEWQEMGLGWKGSLALRDQRGVTSLPAVFSAPSTWESLAMAGSAGKWVGPWPGSLRLGLLAPHHAISPGLNFFP